MNLVILYFMFTFISRILKFLSFRKLSGLNKPRAANIVEYRKTKGPFINREQLKSVKGIGPRTFEQCAGFIRIMPEILEMEINK